MISFITAARNARELDNLAENLARVVFHKNQDIKYELLPEVGRDSIFTAYNEGAKKAQYDCLAFIHTDVEFLCNSKCFEKPLSLVSKPMTGLVGVAGATVLENTGNKPGCWWVTNQVNCRGAVYHSSTQDETGMHINTWPHVVGRFTPVAVVDGVFIMCSKKNFNKLGGFDDKNFSGFHFYDVQLSVEAKLKGLTNHVVPIPLLHKSPGKPDEIWEQNRLKFMEKYGKHLPVRA